MSNESPKFLAFLLHIREVLSSIHGLEAVYPDQGRIGVSLVTHIPC
jgi:hypothetical protein